MKVPNRCPDGRSSELSLSRLQNEGSQLDVANMDVFDKSIKATE